MALPQAGAEGAGTGLGAGGLPLGPGPLGQEVQAAEEEAVPSAGGALLPPVGGTEGGPCDLRGSEGTGTQVRDQATPPCSSSLRFLLCETGRLGCQGQTPQQKPS